MPSAAQAKATWTKVAFGDVVRQVKDKVDPVTAGLERYVAGDHMDTDDLRIRRWGLVGDGYLGPAFHMRFRPGQVLYGSRRTYLRKVAVADFEGITANTTFVLETADPGTLLPEMVPYIMQTEVFHEYSIENSKGSVNPYINFSDLAKFEFALPPVEEQRRIVEVLQAAAETVDRVARARTCAERLFQSKVDHAFVKAAARDGHKVVPLAELSQKIVDGVHKRPDYVGDGIPFLTVENLTRGPGIDFSDTRFVSQWDHEQFCKRAKPEFGDVLISKDGTLGVPRVVQVKVPFSIFVSVALVKPKRDVLDPWFLRFYFESTLFKRHIASRFSGSALKHIHLVDLRESPIPVLALAKQRETARILGEVHAALLALHDRVVPAQRVMQQILGTVVVERA